ncbi:MAG: hypothetical protein IIZ45_06305, partial [Firmicutes bacterium]|nr:hypothetical protein [Bacillota bacterium]
EGTTPHKVLSATEEKTITAEYLLSYILPLFAFDFTQWCGLLFCHPPEECQLKICFLHIPN